MSNKYMKDNTPDEYLGSVLYKGKYIKNVYITGRAKNPNMLLFVIEINIPPTPNTIIIIFIKNIAEVKIAHFIPPSRKYSMCR
jgi:hypothetical protein